MMAPPAPCVLMVVFSIFSPLAGAQDKNLLPTDLEDVCPSFSTVYVTITQGNTIPTALPEQVQGTTPVTGGSSFDSDDNGDFNIREGETQRQETSSGGGDPKGNTFTENIYGVQVSSDSINDNGSDNGDGHLVVGGSLQIHGASWVNGGASQTDDESDTGFRSGSGNGSGSGVSSAPDFGSDASPVNGNTGTTDNTGSTSGRGGTGDNGGGGGSSEHGGVEIMGSNSSDAPFTNGTYTSGLVSKSLLSDKISRTQSSSPTSRSTKHSSRTVAPSATPIVASSQYSSSRSDVETSGRSSSSGLPGTGRRVGTSIAGSSDSAGNLESERSLTIQTASPRPAGNPESERPLTIQTASPRPAGNPERGRSLTIQTASARPIHTISPNSSTTSPGSTMITSRSTGSSNSDAPSSTTAPNTSDTSESVSTAPNFYAKRRPGRFRILSPIVQSG